MSSEQTKGAYEVEVFRRFIEAAKLPIAPSSVEKREPPEPDIRCLHSTDGPIAFELVELCDPNLAKAIATLSTEYIRTSDPSARIVSKKLRLSYDTNLPIELLCYTDGRIITPDDVIIPTITPYLGSWSHVFRRAWLLGHKGKVHELWAV
jgi:hypothetical protein